MSLFDSIANISTLGGYGTVKGLLGGGEDPGKGQLAQVLALLHQAKLENAQAFGAGIGQYKKALPVIDKAFTGAKAAVAGAQASATRGAQDREQQQLAGAGQSLAGRGLYNTTLLGNARRGIIGDTSRILADINANAGQSLGSLGIQQGLAKSSALNQIGGGLERYGQTQSNLTGNIANAISNVQYQKKKDLFDLLGVGAQVAGAFGGFGGGGGGAAGSSTGSSSGGGLGNGIWPW